MFRAAVLRSSGFDNVKFYVTGKGSQNNVPSDLVVQDSVDHVPAEELPVLADTIAKWLPVSEHSKLESMPDLNYSPVDDSEVVEPEVNENLPADNSDMAADQSIPVDETERCGHKTAKEQNEIDGSFIRKSKRLREKPQLFTYPELGNPLV